MLAGTNPHETSCSTATALDYLTPASSRIENIVRASIRHLEPLDGSLWDFFYTNFNLDVWMGRRSRSHRACVQTPTGAPQAPRRVCAHVDQQAHRKTHANSNFTKSGVERILVSVSDRYRVSFSSFSCFLTWVNHSLGSDFYMVWGSTQRPSRSKGGYCVAPWSTYTQTFHQAV